MLKPGIMSFDGRSRPVACSWLSSFFLVRAARVLSLLVFLSGVLYNFQQAYMHYQHQRISTSSATDQENVRSTASSQPPHPHLNTTKVALLIEDRPLPFLTPLLLHFIAVLPPDWTFHFIGSPSSITRLTIHSRTIRQHIQDTKLTITPLPSHTSIASQELISRLMTSLWLWRDVLYPAESVLVFQSDSMLCSHAHQPIEDFLHWDWIGAPWRDKNRIGGNGGFSLRKRRALVEILERERRVDGGDFEDVWFTKRLRKAGKKIAGREEALRWSGESQVPDEMLDELAHLNREKKKKTEKARGKKHGDDDQGVPDPRTRFEPMGYHVGNSGDQFHTNIWGTRELREHVYEYCPEIKMLLPMDAADFVPGRCQEEWEWGKDRKLDHPERYGDEKEV